MKENNLILIKCSLVIIAVAHLMACGTNMGSTPQLQPENGSVAVFGADTPACDIESFVVTITSANLIPQGGGTPVPLIDSASPATVDFARLVGSTNIVNVASVPPGFYSQLQITVANPQMIGVNTATQPPSPQLISTNLTTPTVTATFSPPLAVTSSTTTGMLLDMDLQNSVLVDGSGQVTGAVTPTFSVGSSSGSVGEATSLYGTVNSTDATGFSMTVADGTGQTYTVNANSDTVFEGDGVSGLSDLRSGVFVEVDAVVNSSGQIVAREVDAEEPVLPSGEKFALLGRIIDVARDGAGNATSFSLLVQDQVPKVSGTIPLYSALSVSITANTGFFINQPHLNRQAFSFGPQTLGVAESVAVFGMVGSGGSPTLAANQVFLRPRGVLGHFNALQAVGSDGTTGPSR
jgi:hypothetical protein